MSHQFVHLHLHSHYSILDGVCQIDPLLARAAELGFREMALTDHGAMYGAYEFYSKAPKAGIKPILGFEAYVAPGSRLEKSGGMKDTSNHLTLLAKNHTGYLNLSRLSTIGFTEGYYYKPRVDLEALRAHAEGIIALSGCLKGKVSQHLLMDQFDEAETAARALREVFGEENFFLEIMNNGMEEQQRILEPMRALSKKTGIPLVATSDVHYLLPEHARVQEVMICINTRKTLDDENRMRMSTDDFFLKSPEQMWLAFKGYEDACERSVEIAGRCNIEWPKGAKFHLPVIEAPDGLSAEQYMDRLCREGLRERYGDPLPQEVVERYEKEYDVITKMGFPSYFLLVWDLVNFARQSDIPVGPGRGSAAGSIVAYALKITNLDPLKYDLLFERFLNEGRNEMPDIDLDFDKERRQEVVQHIIRRHGEDHCAKIVTFGCLSAKSAVRDVGRVMGLPLGDVDVIAKMVPDGIAAKGGKSSIQIAMEQNPDLRDRYENDPQAKELLDIAGQLDGVVRQTGIHAAGVLVAPKKITEFCPLAKQRDDVTTQYEMKMLEKLGLCKVDVLGLETLTLIRKAVDTIRINTGREIDIDAIPLDDPATFRMLSRGDAKGVFQFESDGFRALLVKLRPDRFEDLIAAVAMYRPGPLGCGMVDMYIDCKHGRREPEYLHPLMEPLLEETYGLILYQEQVQALARELAHFSLSEGDLMRRAMGKKDAQIMADYKAKFAKQAHDTCGSQIAEQVFEQIEYFAGYGFNKSHSACYALIAYQTAWLKCQYPREYMAALLTTNRGDSDKVVQYTEDARRMGIDVLPPDINESDAYFTVSGENIRFGLSAVKGVGDKAVEGMVEERRANGSFRSLYDFCERVDLRLLNKGAIEALIKAGAFDSMGGHRAQYLAGLEGALSAGGAAQRDAARGQASLFGAVAEELEPALPEVAKWSDREQLTLEKEVLGFYVSSHPLASHEAELRAFATATTRTLAGLPDRAPVIRGGLIASVRSGVGKKDKRYARLVVEDIEGRIGVMIFSSVLEKLEPDLLQADRLVFVVGKVDTSRDEPSVLADEIIPLEEAPERLTRMVVIELESTGVSQDNLSELEGLLAAHRGDIPLGLRVRTHGRRSVLIRAGRKFSVQPSRRLVGEVGKLLGENRVQFSARSAL